MQEIKTKEDKKANEWQEAQSRWIGEIDLVERQYASWWKYGDKLINNYRGCRSEDQGMQFNTYSQSRYNILTSNTQTLQPAIFNRLPVPVVDRRYKDSDVVGRVASEILQRCVTYCISEYNFMDVMKAVRDDYLLPGRGMAWVRYVPHFRTVQPKVWLDEKRIPVQFEGLQITGAVHREQEKHILGYDPLELEEHQYEESQEPRDAKPETADRYGIDGSLAHESAEQFNTAYTNAETGEDVGDDAEIFEDEETGKKYINGEEYEEVVYEEVVCDYVFWKDWLCSLSRRWEEVRWVARKAYMLEDEVKERFGCEKAKDVQYNFRENNGKEHSGDEDNDVASKRACIYEIWDKSSGKVYWVSRGMDEPLDILEDPLKLRHFFPCPKPILSIVTNDSLIPTPFFWIYQDQARELDRLTNKIDKLTQALKIAGLYDSESTEIGRIFEEGAENQLIPVKDWAKLAEKGGASGVISFIPFREIAEVLQRTMDSREVIKRDLYEITGIADIVRGASQAAETATAQRIKGQFATLRLGEMQGEIQRFARDLIAIMAEIISEQFTDETIELISGNSFMQDPQMMQQNKQAIELLRNDGLRTFRIDIETDSTIAADDSQEKQDRSEFLSAMGSFLEKSLPIAMQVPELGPFLGEALMFGMRGFKASRQLESAFEQAMQNLANKQAPAAPQGQPDRQPNPQDAEKIGIEKMKLQNEQGWLEHENAKTGAELQLKAADLQSKNANEQAKIMLEASKMQQNDANMQQFY